MAAASPIAIVIMGWLLSQQHRSHDHGSRRRVGLVLPCPTAAPSMIIRFFPASGPEAL
jgi:hypothetical protein